MVTLGSMHPAPFQQAFHRGATGTYEDPLNFHSFELALNEVDGDMADPSVVSVDPAKERASPQDSSKPARRSSILVPAGPSPDAAEAASSAPREGGGEDHGQGEITAAASSSSSRRQSVYRQSSAHRLFRAAPSEPKQQHWDAPHARSSDDGACAGPAPPSGGDSRLRASSWNSDSRQSPPPPPGLGGGDYNSSNSFFPKRRGRDDKEVWIVTI